MNPTNQTYEYQAPANSGGYKAWKIVGVSLLTVALLAGVSAGVVLTKREATNQASAASNSSAVVTIEAGGTLTPEVVSVKKGQGVTWTNQDGRRIRSIMPVGDEAQTLRGFGTGTPLTKGESYSYVFEAAGTYHYYDSTSSQTTGTVIVTE